MDESDDFLKPTYKNLFNQESFSSKSSNLQDKKVSVEYEQGKENIITKIVYGEDTLSVIDQFAIACQSEVNVIVDKNSASLIINDSEFTKFYTILKNKSVDIRIVTEVNSANMDYCKKIIEDYGAELRHFSDIKVNLAISDDKEYVGFTGLHDSRPLSEVVYSNVREVITQNKFIFETLWNKAISAKQRFREIKDGVLPRETYLINDPKEALAYVQDFIKNAVTGISNSISIEYFKLVDQNQSLLNSYLDYLSKYKEGKVKGALRWITYIDNKKEDVELIEKFLHMGIEIKHVKNLPPLYFSVSSKQCVVTVENVRNGEMFQNILLTTESLYISHYQTVFEELWRVGMDARERIRQLQTDTTLATTKIIENSVDAKSCFIEMVRNAREEILILFPSLNAIKREVIMGIIELLQKKGTQNVRIRILSPVDEKIKEMVLSHNAEDKDLMIQNITSREIRKQDYLISTIVIVDRKFVLATELKDDSKALFEEAIGLCIYSTSRPTIFSYLSIFESLWDQTEMYEQLKIANKKLVQSEELEREFINTAAHELRTPTQAIMGYTEIDIETFDDLLKNSKVAIDDELESTVKHLKKHFDAISRNSIRLDELINNLLDVARIESNRVNSLSLHKEKLDLIKEINDSTQTYLGQKIKEKDIKINFINESIGEECWIYADKLRINQIINNLIDNAIKFTGRNGKIDIMIEENAYCLTGFDTDKNETIKNNGPIEKKEEEVIGKKESRYILVGISDTGKGILPQVMPNLFDKFITGSQTGTGLGLYITRNLVEAHGGKIWAFNNKDGVGATFVFTLPKTDVRV
ncbi:MAG TPA: HAMP domain-containing sensor histidine kinase [Candidatus Saccharimonadales bacterium]|nr:HAMP domain-containing sensor histidine kinase [Candidatus Saccharimonadales bacterium]